MNLNRRKILGIFFSAMVLILIIAILTPALGKNPTIFTPRNGGYENGYCFDPRTPGFWKNHPEAWPVSSIIIGGTPYSKTSAIELMDHPTAGDKTYNMFEHLVAAKLNILSGSNPSGISAVISDADAWMAIYPVGSGVKADSAAWMVGGPLFEQLDTYNNS